MEGGPDAPVLMILDCVPVRVSIAFRKRWKVELPWTKLVFVAPGHTPTCQPLHIAYSKAIKAAVGNKCCKCFGKSVLDAIAEGGSPGHRLATFFAEAAFAVVDLLSAGGSFGPAKPLQWWRWARWSALGDENYATTLAAASDRFCARGRPSR